MDIASIFTLLFVGLASWWAARHVDAWEKDRWFLSAFYTLVSIGCLFAIGLANKRLYFLVLIFYFLLMANLERLVKSKSGHIWFSLFVGISGMFPIAIYQLYFL